MSISHLMLRLSSYSSLRATISGVSRKKEQETLREPACGRKTTEIHMDNCKLTHTQLLFYKSFLIHHLGPLKARENLKE